jgi:hypothetical protein
LASLRRTPTTKQWPDALAGPTTTQGTVLLRLMSMASRRK